MQTFLNGKKICRFSRCSIPIEVGVCNKTSGTNEFMRMADATGFLFNADGKTFFVSNWHVFDGHEFDGKYTPIIKGQRLALPEKLVIHSMLNRQKVFLDLQDKDGRPLWFYNRDLSIDIAIIKIETSTNKIIQKMGWLAINEIWSQEDLSVEVADDVFIVGHPHGKRGSTEVNAMPIYKRGTVASEPELSYYSNRKSFLIDSTTRPGMSGSPVIAVSRNGYISNGTICINSSTYFKFLGVYSGRIDGDAAEESSLGIVWDKSLIEDLITELKTSN